MKQSPIGLIWESIDRGHGTADKDQLGATR